MLGNQLSRTVMRNKVDRFDALREFGQTRIRQELADRALNRTEAGARAGEGLEYNPPVSGDQWHPLIRLDYTTGELEVADSSRIQAPAKDIPIMVR